MATIIGESREGTVSVRRVGGRNIVEAQILYLVRSYSNSESRASILATSGLPLVGTTVSQTLGLCVAKDASRRADNAQLWDVTATFSTEVAESISETQQNGNPLSFTPIAELNFEKYDQRFVRDCLSVPYANSAGEPFTDGLTVPFNILRWDFFQFEAITKTYWQISKQNNVVNSQIFLTFPEKSLLCTINRAQIGVFYGVRCWMIEYSLRYKYEYQLVPQAAGGGVLRRDWRLEVLDIAQGSRAAFPYGRSLDGNGTLRAEGELPAIRQFDVYPPDDFSFIRLANL